MASGDQNKGITLTECNIMEKISGFLRGRHSKSDNKEQKTLPAHFAEELLNLELQIEANPQLPIETVNRLIELYSVAVQYYESIHSNKYIVFKNKITKLLINPMVNRAMNDSCPSESEPGCTPHSESRKRSLEKNLSYAIQNTEGDVRHLLINASDRRDNVVRIVTTNILEQEYAIRERLRRRRKDKDISEKASTEGDADLVGELAKGKLAVLVETEPQQQDNVLQENQKQQEAHGNSTNQQTKQEDPSLPKQDCQQQTHKQDTHHPHEKGKKQHKKLLKLKSNQHPQQLPSQYTIPF